MRLIILLLLNFYSIGIVAQSLKSGRKNSDAGCFTHKQNESWLTDTKSLNTSGQWTAIKSRFFLNGNQCISGDSLNYAPVIVINGVPFNLPKNLTAKGSKKILNLLNEDAIEQLTVLDKLKEEWTFCKPFSGVIMMTIDKRTSKKISRLRLE